MITAGSILQRVMREQFSGAVANTDLTVYFAAWVATADSYFDVTRDDNVNDQITWLSVIGVLVGR